MKPCLAQVCTLGASFEADVADYAAGQCRAIEIWLGKLEHYLESHSLDDVRRLLDEHEMKAPVASFQGGLLDSQGEQRREHWEHFQRRLELCRNLGINTLIIACDVARPLEQQDIDRVKLSLREAAASAALHDVRLALEPQASAALGNNVQTALALMDEAGSENLGLCLDIFHFATGPSKSEDLLLLNPGNLFHVQVCDLSGVPRELAADADRILPGDGELPLAGFIEHLGSISYEGHVSVELMNPQLWQVPPLQFGEIAMTAVRRLLGQAGMV